MPEFKIGDVVKLKSGGPKMTIEDRTMIWDKYSTTHWDCVWFDEKNVYKKGSFHQDTLELTSSEFPIAVG